MVCCTVNVSNEEQKLHALTACRCDNNPLAWVTKWLIPRTRPIPCTARVVGHKIETVDMKASLQCAQTACLLNSRCQKTVGNTSIWNGTGPLATLKSPRAHMRHKGVPHLQLSTGPPSQDDSSSAHLQQTIPDPTGVTSRFYCRRETGIFQLVNNGLLGRKEGIGGVSQYQSDSKRCGIGNAIQNPLPSENGACWEFFFFFFGFRAMQAWPNIFTLGLLLQFVPVSN